MEKWIFKILSSFVWNDAIPDCTVLVLRMAHRIWKETKQHPGTASPDNMLGCCLVSFHFLYVILSTNTVVMGVIKWIPDVMARFLTATVLLQAAFRYTRTTFRF